MMLGAERQSTSRAAYFYNSPERGAAIKKAAALRINT